MAEKLPDKDLQEQLDTYLSTRRTKALKTWLPVGGSILAAVLAVSSFVFSAVKENAAKGAKDALARKYEDGDKAIDRAMKSLINSISTESAKASIELGKVMARVDVHSKNAAARIDDRDKKAAARINETIDSQLSRLKDAEKDISDFLAVVTGLPDQAEAVDKLKTLAASFAGDEAVAQLTELRQQVTMIEEDLHDVLPVGTIMPYGGSILTTEGAPMGWLLCDGAPVPEGEEYDRLRKLLQATGWGARGAVVLLPDLRGMFLRGVDDPDGGAGSGWQAAGNDEEPHKRQDRITGEPSTLVGSIQDDAVGAHPHDIDDPKHGHRSHLGSDPSVATAGRGTLPMRSTTLWQLQTGSGTNAVQTGITVQPNKGPETRPKNAYVNFIIKY